MLCARTTKCNGLVANNPSIHTYLVPGLNKLPKYVNQSGLSRTAVFDAVDASLAHIDTPYINLLQILITVNLQRQRRDISQNM